MWFQRRRRLPTSLKIYVWHIVLDATRHHGRASGSWWLNTEKHGNFAVPFSTHPNLFLPNNNKSRGDYKTKIIKNGRKKKKETKKKHFKKKWLEFFFLLPKVARCSFDITSVLLILFTSKRCSKPLPKYKKREALKSETFSQCFLYTHERWLARARAQEFNAPKE